MRKFILLVPLIYILPHLVSNPTMGVYLAEPSADVLAVAFTPCALLPSVWPKLMRELGVKAKKSQPEQI